MCWANVFSPSCCDAVLYRNAKSVYKLNFPNDLTSVSTLKRYLRILAIYESVGEPIKNFFLWMSESVYILSIIMLQ